MYILSKSSFIHLDSDKKIEVYELLSESKLKLKRKRLVSRKKSKKEQSSLDKIEE